MCEAIRSLDSAKLQFFARVRQNGEVYATVSNRMRVRALTVETAYALCRTCNGLGNTQAEWEIKKFPAKT